MGDHDVLSIIPGDVLSAAQHSLPDATLSQENAMRVVVDLPGGLRAQVTFCRVRYKRPQYGGRRFRLRWFWDPVSAVLLE
jgi:hypothetical protein